MLLYIFFYLLSQKSPNRQVALTNIHMDKIVVLFRKANPQKFKELEIGQSSIIKNERLSYN